MPIFSRLWLNEGFASYMEYIGTNHVEPDTGILDRFVLESMHPTFKQGQSKGRPRPRFCQFPSFILVVEAEFILLSSFLQQVAAKFKIVSFPDSLHSSHPISVPVNHPDAINEIFDSISYGKGASVIRVRKR